MPFTQFGLHSSLLSNIRKLGYITPTPIQSEAIPVVQAGRDLIATAQTGTGKTAAFLLPILNQLLAGRTGTTSVLILTPTRELATQIDTVFRGLAAGTGFRSAIVIGGVAPLPQTRALRAGVEVIIATPGRMLDHLEHNVTKLLGLKTLILDEADQMFDMGFLPTIKSIVAKLPKERQTLLFSATMPSAIESLSKAILKNPHAIAIGPQGTPTTNVAQSVYPVGMRRKAALLQHLLESWEMPSVLVFTRTKHAARKVAKTLSMAGHGVAELHSDRSPTQRSAAMKAFRNKVVPIMVATNIAARGLDVRHITHVVNFDVPDASDEYVHRIGRAGRAGDKGESIVLMAPEETSQMSRIERQLRQRITRKTVAEFDYTAPAPTPVARTEDHRARPDAVLPRAHKKPMRGQGGRR